MATNRNLAFCIGTALSAAVFGLGQRIFIAYSPLPGVSETGLDLEHLFAFKLVLALCLVLVLVSLLICLLLRRWTRNQDKDKQNQDPEDRLITESH